MVLPYAEARGVAAVSLWVNPGKIRASRQLPIAKAAVGS
ncbi:hypothetical protein SYN65AY640_04845 [Synechococcus sp. 65AY640]|nr:hypothetical protein SYN65AY640_04845 [Synechococcus sp. 65AY640]